MVLRPGLPLLWRGPTEVQVGTDPRWAVTLADLSPAAALALRDVSPGAGAGELTAALDRAHVTPQETAAVVAHLRQAGLLLSNRPTARTSADSAAWSLVTHDGDGVGVLARRARATVRVSGLGRLGGGVALLLALAGVGTVELDDDQDVVPDDLGPGGLTARDLGTARAGATARVLHDAAPAVRTPRPAAGTRARAVDLVVLVEHDVADPLSHRSLMDDDVPHLSVVVREASVLIGPLVVPGATACLRCVDLHRCDLDPGWPVVAAQLAGRPAERAVETALAAAAAATTAAQALAFLDGRPTSVREGSLELRLPEVSPRHIPWPAHPDCGCLGPGTTEAPTRVVSGPR